jgi:DNA gyrase subunit A
MFTCSTHDYILAFTSLGRVYRLLGYDIPEGSRNSKGTNIVNILPLNGGERVTTLLQAPRDMEGSGQFICMVTRKGIVKRTRLQDFKNTRKNGLIALNLREGDALAEVCLTEGDEELLVATKYGYAIRFNENDARPLGRNASGVKALALRDADEVVGFDVITPGKTILTISTKGYGRRSEPDSYRLQSRGGMGVRNYHPGGKYGQVAAVAMVSEEDDIILIASDGIVIRCAAGQISLFSRTSHGVRVMKCTAGESVAAIAVTPKSEESDADIPTVTNIETEPNEEDIPEEDILEEDMIENSDPDTAEE